VLVCISLEKAVTEMTFTVSGGTLNPTHSLLWQIRHMLQNNLQNGIATKEKIYGGGVISMNNARTDESILKLHCKATYEALTYVLQKQIKT